MDSDVDLDLELNTFGMESLKQPKTDEFDSESDSSLNTTIMEVKTPSKLRTTTVGELETNTSKKLDEGQPPTANQARRARRKRRRTAKKTMSLDHSSEVLSSDKQSEAIPANTGETFGLVKGNVNSLELNKEKAKALARNQPSYSGGVQSKLNKGGLEKPKGTPSNSSETRKRPRGSDATPPELKNPVHKRTKSFASVVTDCNLVMAISNDKNSDGTVTATQFNEIIEKIVQSRSEVLPDGIVPNFHGYKHVQGIPLITCADVSCKEWLVDRINHFNQSWPDMTLRAVEKGSLAKMNRGMVFIPSGPGFPSRSGAILVDLKLSNPGLKTEKWKVYSSKLHAHGQSLFIGIDDDSLTVLKERDFKAFFALVSVDFRIHERKQKEPVIEAPLK